MSTIAIDTIVNACSDVLKAIPSIGVSESGEKLVYPRVRYVNDGRDIEFKVLVGDYNFSPPRAHFWMLFNTTSIPILDGFSNLVGVEHTIKFFGHMAVVDSAAPELESASLFRAEIDAILAAFADSIDLGLGCSITHQQFRVLNAGDGQAAGALCHIAECALPVTAYNV